jgi:hypothetical protein
VGRQWFVGLWLDRWDGSVARRFSRSTFEGLQVSLSVCAAPSCWFGGLDFWLGLGKISTVNLMLGVKFNNRESVHGPMKVVLTPNIGLETIQTRSVRDLLDRSYFRAASEGEL